jgi:hypothetical protein
MECNNDVEIYNIRYNASVVPIKRENKFTGAVLYALLRADLLNQLQIITSQEITDFRMDEDANENISKITARSD